MDNALAWAKPIIDWLPSFLEQKLSVTLGPIQLANKIQLSENLSINIHFGEKPEIKIYLDCSRDSASRPWSLTATKNDLLQGTSPQLRSNENQQPSEDTATVDRLDHYVFADSFITSRQERRIGKSIYATTLPYHDLENISYLHDEKSGYFSILAESPLVIKHSASLGKGLTPVDFIRNTARPEPRTWTFQKYNARQILQLQTNPVSFISINSKLVSSIILATFWRHENEPYYYVFVLRKKDRRNDR